jgi:hypothetical protein
MYPILWYNEYMENTSQGERRISIRFSLDVVAAIRALAKQHERSFNGEVLWALREYAERHKGKQ